MKSWLPILLVVALLASACGWGPVAQSAPLPTAAPTTVPPPTDSPSPTVVATVVEPPPAPENVATAEVTEEASTGAAGAPTRRLAPSGLTIDGETLARVERLFSLSGHSPRLAGLAFQADGKQLASVSKNFALRLWDVETGRRASSPVWRSDRIYNVAFSPDGALMATEGADMTIDLLEVRSGRGLGSLDGHGTHLLAMSFSPDGRLLATAGDDAQIKLWEVETGRELRTLAGHLTAVTALAFAADGALLASGGARFSTVIKIWDLATGDELRTLTGHSDNVHSLAFSPDGALLASAGLDRTLRLWSTKNGQQVRSLREEGDPAYGLAFSPDGTLLASTGNLGEIQFWEVNTGRALRTLAGHSNDVLSLAFSPDGSLLASGGIDSNVFLWGVPGAELSAGPPDLPEPTAEAAEMPVVPLASGDGGRIAFSSYRDGESKIFTMDLDGADITLLSRTGLRETRPDWSPDGTKIAYVRRVSRSDHEIYVMNADGSGVTRLTNRPDSIESEPAWSPDGSRIAFISNERPNLLTFSGRFQIWVMKADGSDQTLLTEIGGANTSPDWSPDGQKILFDSTRDGNHEIYVMNADGSDPVNLTLHPAHDTSPAWSPDGTRIVFVSDRDGDQEIYLMNADGSGQTRLTERFGFDKAPSWSPDGRYVVFYSRHEKNNTEIYRMRADGSEQVRLTHDADFDGFPTWKPCPLAAAEAAPAEGESGLAVTQPSSAEMVASLEGLPLAQFFEESFKLLMLRDPEWVTAEGLSARFGTGNGQLTDLSDAYARETHELQSAILDLLQGYDRDALSFEEQVSYDVYEWYLDDLVRGHEFMYHDYPVTHFTTGVQYQLLQLFADLHPMASRQDAEDYVQRLSQVGKKFDGLVEGLLLREEVGVVLPGFLFSWLMGDIRGIARSQPRFTPFYGEFESRLAALDLPPAERQALLEDAEQAIAESVIPAFGALAGTLEALQPSAPASGGVWQLPDGMAYYEYILRHHTTTDLTPDQIHELGLQELARIQEEMRSLFAQLGYPQEDSIPELYARLAREGGSVSGGQVAETYESILAAAEQNLDPAFDRRPQAELIVVAGSEGDYYVSGSLDGSRPGAFYARISGGSQETYGMRTLAYHEGVPGHHFQISLAQESDLPLFRNVLGFTGYAEGWALYAEQLAAELGWYEDDAYGDLGRLQGQAFRAARLVVDTGLHDKGWSFDQAHEFMVENTGQDPGFMQFEVSRYVAWPGQATAYMVGMLEIMALRQRAMDQLGDRFDLRDFHNVVLSNGSMPLEVLKRVVDGYIAAKLAQEG